MNGRVVFADTIVGCIRSSVAARPACALCADAQPNDTAFLLGSGWRAKDPCRDLPDTPRTQEVEARGCMVQNYMVRLRRVDSWKKRKALSRRSLTLPVWSAEMEFWLDPRRKDSLVIGRVISGGAPDTIRRDRFIGRRGGGALLGSCGRGG